MVRDFCQGRFKHLTKMLIKDVMHLPKQIKATRREPSDSETEFNNEAIELFATMMGKDRALMGQFIS